MGISNNTVEILAKELGFNLVGFSNVDLLDEEVANLQNWIAKGYHSRMEYMERNLEKKKDVKLILQSAESVISLGMNYYVNAEYDEKDGTGKVSRYAWGKDYHFVIWEKLETLIGKLKMIDASFEAVSYVDTGPVMDKVWAVKSGLGWQGKNSNVINPEFGSWFFIATIISNFKFLPSATITDHCGNCTACIDACPTSAIVEPKVVDANKCISYLTIENKGDIPEEFVDKFEGWVFGCDICQDVCPWNIKFAKPTAIKEFLRIENKEIELESVSNLTNSKFKKKYFESPIYRAKAKGLKRNANFLLETKKKKLNLTTK